MAERDRRESHVFLSYVREDAAEVDRLQRALDGHGIRTWRDTGDLAPGESWQIRLRQAITEDALVFLACFSDNSLARAKTYQHEELLFAVDEFQRRRPDHPWLIPVRFSDCEIPPYDLGAGRTLQSLHWLDLFGDNWDRGIERLVAQIQAAMPNVNDTPTQPSEAAPDTRRRRPVSELHLELVASLDSGVVAVVEPLIEAITFAIEQGLFDSDPMMLRTLERDRSSLRAELYENPDVIDTGIVLATSYRVLRNLGPALLDTSDRTALSLLPTASSDPLDAEEAIRAAGTLAAAAGESAEAQQHGLTTYEWITIQLGWYPYALADGMKRARSVIRADGAEFVSTSSGVTGVLALLGLGGWAATLVGAYVGMLSAAWRNRDSTTKSLQRAKRS